MNELTPEAIDALELQGTQSQGRSLAGKVMMPEEIDSIPTSTQQIDTAEEGGGKRIPNVGQTMPTTAGGQPLSVPAGGSFTDEASDLPVIGPIIGAGANIAQTGARTLGLSGRGVAAIAEDIAEAPAQSQGYQQPFRNLRSLGAMHPADVLGGTEKMPVTPFEQETPQTGTVQRVARGAYTQLAQDVPKFAMLPLAGESLAAQSAAAGGLFGMDQDGNFHPKDAVVMALLPGVGKVARMGTASIVGRAISSGAMPALEHAPQVQKVLEEVGHQVALDGYMTLANMPELVDQYQKDPSQAAASLGGILVQNLGFALLGASRFNAGVPSDTMNWIHDTAQEMANDAIKARVAQEYTGPELRAIYQRVNSNSPDATPEEQNLVRFINSQLGKGQSQAIRSGVRVTTTEHDFENVPEFWKKYMPKAAGPKQSVEVMPGQEPTGQPTQQPQPSAQPSPTPAGPRPLLPEEIDATDTERNVGSVPGQQTGTTQVGQTGSGAGGGDIVPGNAGQRGTSTPAVPPTPAPVPPPKPGAPAVRADVAARVAAGINPKNVRISVQSPRSFNGLAVPGYVQVEEIDPEKNVSVLSSNPDALNAAGFHMPSQADLMKLPTGVYSLEDAISKLTDAGKPPKVTTTGKATKPEVAKIGTGTTRLNQFGDTFNTTYHATPEDWAKWVELKRQYQVAREAKDFAAMKALGVENERIKNIYGGMPPEPPKATAETPPTVPETPETVALQMEMLRRGQRDAMLVTPGEKEPEIPKGFKKLTTPEGLWIYDPNKIGTKEIGDARRAKTTGLLLGYGIPDKPAKGTEIGAVVVRTKEGVEKIGVLTDQAHLESVKKALGKYVEAGDTMNLEPEAQVIARRQVKAKPATALGYDPKAIAKGKHFIVFKGTGVVHIYQNVIAAESAKVAYAEAHGGEAELDERVGKSGETFQDLIDSANKVVGKGSKLNVVVHSERPEGSLIEVDQPPSRTRKADDLAGMSEDELDAMLDEAAAPKAETTPPSAGKGRLSRVNKLRQMLSRLEERAERLGKKLEEIGDTEVRGTSEERQAQAERLSDAKENFERMLRKIDKQKPRLAEELRKAEIDAVKAGRDVEVTNELKYGVPVTQWDLMSTMSPEQQKEKYGTTQSTLMQEALTKTPKPTTTKPKGRSLLQKPKELPALRKADTSADVRLDMPGITRAAKPNSLVIQLRDLESHPLRDVVLPTSGDPMTDAKTVTAELHKHARSDNKVSLRESLAVTTGPNGRAVLKFSMSPNGMTWASAQAWLALVEGPKQKPKTLPKPGVVPTPPTQAPAPEPAAGAKSAADILGEAAKSGIKGIDESIKGLHDLFGGGAHMGTFGTGFDEETYQKAKPHFEKAYEQFKRAGKSLKEFFQFIFQQFGIRIRPYLKRFIQELQAKAGGATVPTGANEPTESTVGNRGPRGTEPPAPGPTGKGTQTGAAPQGASGPVQPGTGQTDEGATGEPGTLGGGEPDADVNGVPPVQGPAPAESGGGENSSGGTTTVLPGTAPAAPAPIPEIGASGPENLHFTEPQAPTGLAARADANIAAIELVKQLEAENRFPTDEERLKLAKWSGWGSFKELFNEGRSERRDYDVGWVKSYGKRYDKLRKLLTPDEFNAAAESSVNAHFTGPDVVVPMWDIARRLGFKGGRTLESSAGGGNFIGFQPADLAKSTQWTSVEMEPITGKIMSYLYPQNDNRIQPFEETKIPNGFYELAIGNVPFHETGPGKEYPDLNLHNYFIARMLDKVRPGGLVITITTSNTMESQAEQRAFLADKGQLVGAIRLPNNAFAGSAGTEVTTDILVLRKPDGKPFDAQAWLNRNETEIEVPNDLPEKHPVNEYFVNHPEMVLGKHALTGTMYRKHSYTVEPTKGGTIEQKIRGLVDKFPENIVQQTAADLVPTVTQMEDGTLMLDEKGRVMEARGFKLEMPLWDTSSSSLVARAKRFIALRDVLLEQYRLEGSKDATEQEMEANRKKLKASYSKWLNAEGTLNVQTRKTGFLRGDPYYFTVMGLEKVKEVEDPSDSSKTKTVIEPADVLSQRVILPDTPPDRVENATEALGVSLAYKGGMDLDYLKALTGMDDEQIENELVANGLAYKDPESGGLVTTNDYLSGDIRDKLAKAIFAAKESDIFARNVEALRAAVPMTVPFEKISTSINARWQPVPVINRFASLVLGLPDGSVSFVPKVEEFMVREMERYELSEVAKTQWSTDRMNATKLLYHALNFKRALIKVRTPDDKYVTDDQATALANQMIDKISKEYENFIRTTKATVPYRYFDADKGDYVSEDMGVWDALEREFNKKFNSFVEPKYDGSVLKLPGLALWVRRNPHLLNAVMRAIMDGSAVFAHGVGSGKTLLGVALGHELKRIGLSKKFIHAVKKPTVDQWRVTIERAYPGSKILVPDEKDFKPANRQKLVARIASGRWDFIILTHEQLKAIRPGEQLVNQFYNEQLEQLRQILRDMNEEDAENAKSTRGMVPAVRNIVKKLKTLKKKLDEHISAAQKHQDKSLPWEKLGIDGLFVDESHNFKKMPIPTQMDGEIKGIPNDFSQRAVDLLIKLRSVQQRTNGRNVFFASGTPISNTLAEVWVQLHAVNPELLKAFSVETFDSFASAFARVETNFEYTWDDKFKDITRMARFKNPAGFSMLTRLGVDIRMGNKELGLDVPELEGGKPIVHIVKPTPPFKRWLTLLQQIVSKWDNLEPIDRYFNSWVPIATMRAGVAAAVDPRCVFPDAEDHPDSKVNQAVRLILDELKAGTARRTTMMVFCDMYGTMNTDKLMGFVGGSMKPPIEVEADIEPVTDAEEKAGDEEQEGDPEAAKDEDAYTRHLVGKFNLYEDIKRKLVAAGVPEHEVAIITEHGSDAKRESLFNKVRSGQVRVLIGSTEKIGEGVDVPQRMSTQVHLDPPMSMTSAKLEQRFGRLIRQGNLHSPKNWNIPVRVHMLAQERSMDAAIYQLMQNKSEMVLQFLRGNFMGDEFDDPASDFTVALAEMKAAATGDNRAIEVAKLTKEVRELNMEQGAYHQRMSELRRNIDEQARSARYSREVAADYRKLGAAVSAATGDMEKLTLLHVRSQERFTGEKDIRAWLKGLQKAMVEATKEEKSSVEASLIFGDNVRVRAKIRHDVKTAAAGGEAQHVWEATATTYLGGPEPKYDDPSWESSLTTMEGILAALQRMPTGAEDRAKREMESSTKADSLAEAYQKQFNSTTFDKADELAEKTAKLYALQAALRAPPPTPWDLMMGQAAITSPPLHVRIVSDMQRLNAQLQPLLLAADKATDRYRLAVHRNLQDADELEQEMDQLDEKIFNLQERLEDLQRRLSTVEKARLGSARAGTLNTLPYGRTPSSHTGISYDIAEPEGTTLAPEVRARGVQQLRTLLQGRDSGLSDEARAVALDMLSQPALQGLAWNRLTVSIRDRLNQVAAGARQGKGFSGTADVANWLIELSRGARPETFPHEVFHFLYELLPQADKDRINELRLDAMQKAYDTAGSAVEQDAVLHYLQASHPGMTSVGFVSLWQQIAQHYPGAKLDVVMRKMYRLINPTEFLAHIAGEDFAKESAEARQRSWFDEFIHRIRTWFQGLMDSLRRFLGHKPEIQQIIREMLSGKNLDTPEGGLTAERIVSGALEEEQDATPPASAGLPVANIELKGEAEQALADEDVRSAKTRVFGRVDKILGREGLGPAERAAGTAHAKGVFDKAGLQVEAQANGLWKLTDEGLESEIEGRNLLKLVRKEISEQDQPGRAGTGYLGNLLNSVVENMTADRVKAFSPELKRDLYAVAQGERSQRGILLAALGGLSNTVQYVARNVDVVLSKTYSDAFGGDFVRSIVDRIATNFRDYFTEKEIEDALQNSPQLADLIDRAMALNRRDEGGRVYRRAQNMLKPKGLKNLGALEQDARVTEAVETILEQLKNQGIEPQPNPNKPLPPLQRLLMMVHPKTADKIDALIAKAISQAMRNAGIKQALNEAEDDAEREDLQGRFFAGEEPTDEQMEQGLELPEFAHWKALRDNLLGYNPVTVRLTQDLLRHDFRGTKFAPPKEKLQDTRLDLDKLAKQPEEEVERVLNAYFVNLENSVDMTHATPGTRQRVLGMVEKMVSDQLEAARARARSPMFQPPKDPRVALTPEQRIGQLINAGIFRDERLDVPELVQRVAAKAATQRLTPKMPELVRQALDVPFYRQGEIAEHFAQQLIQTLGVTAEQADKAMEVFETAFKQKFKVATEKARERAQESLTPAERREAGPRKALWRKIIEATNAGIFDSGTVLQNIARAHGWNVPTAEDVQKMHDLAEQLQRLSELTAKERDEAGPDQKNIGEAKAAKIAATAGRRIEVRRQIETRWARMVRPISFRHPFQTRRNIAAALNEFEVANLLLKVGFPIRLATHITSQLMVHTPTRAIGEAFVRFANDRSADRDTHLWGDLYTTLRDAYKDTLGAVVPALEAARAALAGRAEARNVDRLLSGVQAIGRMSLKADELAAGGDHVRAGVLKLLALIRISLRVTQALDNFQGTPAESQEMRGLVITSLRENGRTPAEAEAIADQIIGDANDEMPKAAAEVTAFMKSAGIEPSGARVIEAARELVKQRQYARMAAFGLPADDFQERIRLLRRVISWQERTTTGPGGIVASAGKGASAVMEHAGLPLSFTRFANAFGTGINYALMFTPLYSFANARLAGSEPSPWFKTETDRMQRRAQAVIGSMFGALALLLAATGAVIVRLSWPTDRKERELLEATGHRLGTIEIRAGADRFIPISLSVGPAAMLAMYFAGGGALHDLLVKRQEAQAALEKDAAKTGLPPGKIRPIDTADLLGVGWAAAERAMMGSRTAVGLTSSITDQGVPNSRKTVAAYLSPLLPGLPAFQELTRMAGVNLDAKLASVFDFMVPLPTSQARAVNMLGDPVRTPDDLQRIFQTITAGTYPVAVNEAALKARDGYAALFNSGWTPPAIDPNKGYAIDGEFRPMTDAEIERYTVARGQQLSQALTGMDYADAGLVKTAYLQANDLALQSVGVNTAAAPLQTVSASAGGSSVATTLPAGPTRFVAPSAASLTVPEAGSVAGPRAPALPRMPRAGSSLRVGGRRAPAPRSRPTGSLRKGSRGITPRKPRATFGRSLRLRSR